MKTPFINEKNIEDRRAILTFTVSADIDYFEGHFPEHPVLPGVVQLAWAAGFAEQYFNHGLRCKKVEVLKFNNIIEPGMDITLTLEYKKESEKIHFQYMSEKGTHSSGRLVME